MSIESNILQLMLKNDLADGRAFMLSHHREENPENIDVKADEVILIHAIDIEAENTFWLEYHSATESRLIEKEISATEQLQFTELSRHKGKVRIRKNPDALISYQIRYIKLKMGKACG